MDNRDALFMEAALQEAEYAFALGEVPVGAVAVLGDKILARAHNRIESLSDPLRHAEIILLENVRLLLGQKWLNHVEVYVTIEPCIFCAGAMVLTRVKRIIFGAHEPRTGAFGSKADINTVGLNHTIEVTAGINRQRCAALMQEFFKKVRRENKDQP